MALPTIAGRGFILSEVEGSTTKSGKIMARFATAHSKSRKNEDTGEWERVSQAIIRWVAFDSLAEFILESVHTKTEVDVYGEFSEDEWTGDDGVVRKSLQGVLKACSPSIERRDNNNSGGGFQSGGGSAYL